MFGKSPLCLFVAILFLSGCSRSESESHAPTTQKNLPPFWMNTEGAPFGARLTAGDDSQKRWWLEKTVRLLRGGEGLRAGENVAELMALPREQIVEKLQQDARFGDMALDFNIYFLGFKTDAIRKRGKYTDNVYTFPSALLSARDVLNHGDYMHLFDLSVPVFSGPAKAFPLGAEDKDQPNIEILHRRVKSLQDSLRKVIDFARQEPAPTTAAICEKFTVHFDNGTPLILTGMDIGVFQISVLGEKNWYFRALAPCLGGQPTTVPELTANLEEIFKLNERYFTLTEPLYDPSYEPSTVADVKHFDLTTIGFAQPWLSWGFQQRFNLVNSSTNSNRKRSAYALKRFFCDDLTPIGVENPKEHAGGGAHGSDPSCMACHYKLDPMAGYFRDYGLLFQDFSDRAFIAFDDKATAVRTEYQKQWLAENGSLRTWNVGYIRSASDETKNDYGSSLGDLHSLLRRAPEVKQCLVKRIFEYAVGEGQTMDPGYIQEVAKEFDQRTKATNSSDAFRWLTAQVALSQTFVAQNPDPSDCYDRPSGIHSANSPPCRVAYLMQQNCKSCHSSTDGKGNLNLTSWTTGPDGKGNFPHLGGDGKQMKLADTLELILARLGSADPDERMPRGQYMSAQDRQALYLWAQEALSQLKKGK